MWYAEVSLNNRLLTLIQKHIDCSPPSKGCERAEYFVMVIPMKTLTPLLTILFISFLSSPVRAQDFNKGFDAYNDGDYSTAIKEWRPLAEQGVVVVQYNLGVMHEIGQGVPQDYKEAIRWYTLAAEQGKSDSQYNLGVIYSKPEDILQDYKECHNHNCNY